MRALLIALFLFFNIASVAFASEAPFQDAASKKIFAQGRLIHEGHALVEQFRFDEAALKFQEALNPGYTEGIQTSKAYPTGLVVKAYRYAGEYEKASEALRYFTDRPQPHIIALLEQQQLEAMLIWQKTGNKKPIYDFIEKYKEQNKDRIPPTKWPDQIVMANVAELYDLIGDYDAGIAWARMFLKEGPPASKRVKQDYEGLIQAFEESKRGMPKVCSDDGKYCIGRATAYIIRSSYF